MVTSGDVDPEQRGGQPVQRRRGVRVAALGGRALHVRGPARRAGAGLRARRPARQALLRVLPPRGPAAHAGQL